MSKKRQDRPGQAARSREREIVLQPEFLEDLQYWAETDPRLLRRLIELMKAIKRDPFVGIGKPERLRHSLADVLVSQIE